METGDEAGAQKQFQRALSVLQQDAAQKMRDDIQKVIERSLRQRRLANELIGVEHINTLLDSQRELVDCELLTMLAASISLQAVNHRPVTEVLHNAYNVERVAQKLGQTSDFIEMLLNYYKLHHQYDGVEAVLRERLLTRPDDLDLQKDLAIALFQQGNHVEARRVLLKVLKKRPNDASVHSSFSVILYELNDKAGAFAHARRALELNPNEPAAVEVLRQSRGEPVIIFRNGKMAVREEDLLTQSQEKLAAAMAAAIYAADPEQIEDEFKGVVPEVIETAPGAAGEDSREASRPSAKDYLDQAESFFVQARFDEALNYYKLAIEADPNLAQAYMGMGDVYYQQGQYHQAIAYFEESIAITPDPYTHRFLGDAYQHIGKYKQAEEAYRAALNLYPAYRGAQEALQDLLRERKPDEG